MNALCVVLICHFVGKCGLQLHHAWERRPSFPPQRQRARLGQPGGGWRHEERHLQRYAAVTQPCFFIFNCFSSLIFKPFKSLMCISSPLLSVTGEEYWTRAPKARGRLNPLAGTSLTVFEIVPPTSLMISTWLSLCVRLPQVWLWRRGDGRSGAASQTEADKLRQEHTGLRPLPKRNPKVGSRTNS